jgi:putative SOS response-associated peptidase YedK
MCGRYLITSAPEAFRQLFGYREQPNFPPRYNVAPTQPVPIVRLANGERQFALVRWGLIPPFVEDPRAFSLLINARSESVNERPAFRYAMRRRRCLFPADGFYAWKQDGEHKRPYCVRPKHGEPIAFAGLWETWTGPNGEEMETAAIITSAANRELAALHQRTPVIMPPDAFDFWLDCCSVDALTAAAILAPAREGLLEAYEISPAVNRTANDGPELIAPVSAAAASAQARTAPPDAVAAAVKARSTRSRAKRDDGQSSLF